MDLESGAVVGVTVRRADTGDTTSMVETLIAAAEQVEAVQPDEPGIEEVIGDKGYHSNETLADLKALGLCSYISEPGRGRRCWKGSQRPAMRCMLTGAGFAASGAVACCGVEVHTAAFKGRTALRAVRFGLLVVGRRVRGTGARIWLLEGVA